MAAKDGTDRGNNHRGGGGRFERSLTEAQRDAEAARLRSEGLTYPEIAKRMGFRSMNAAWNSVHRAIAAVPVEPATAVREMELARLDEALRVAFEILRGEYVTEGQKTGQTYRDDKPRLMAIDRIVKIMERRAKLLGLDAPTQVQVITVDAVDAEIARLEAELGLTGGPGAAGPAAAAARAAGRTGPPGP